MTLKYATTLQLAEVLGIFKSVPSWDVAGTPTNETVGTGDDSNATFYLDHQNIVASSYTLYYGATAAATNTLTETTHYTLAKDTGKITLTAAGITLLSTSTIYAAYKYFDNGMTDSYLTTVLERAEVKVDNKTNSTFTNTSGDNPSYPVETEIQTSEGTFQDRFIVSNKPLIDISTTLDGDITATDTTISLAAGTGVNFPTSGTIIIGSEVVTYTGVSTDDLTTCTRGALSSTAATHTSGDAVHTTVFFRSDTTEGSAVEWEVQAWDTDMFAKDTGLIYKFKDVSPDPLTRQSVANRIKIIYLHGYDEIPVDITRLTLLLAKRMLMQDNVGKAIIAGRDEFSPELFNVDKDEIDDIIGSYVILAMGNT